MQKRPIARWLLGFGIVVALMLAVVFVYPDRAAWVASRRLSAALRDARQVTFVEFADGVVSGELVLTRAAATPADIVRLKSATSPWFAPVPPWKMLCFTPHHRIEITDADGSQTRLEICFLCENFRFNREEEITLPGRWQDALRLLFASVGMPSRTSEEYQSLIAQHPDRALLDKELRESDHQ